MVGDTMKHLPAIAAFLGLINAVDIPKDKPPKGMNYTSQNINDMMGEMVGKSKAEKRKIMKKYGMK